MAEDRIMKFTITNPRYNEYGTIDCEVDYPGLGVIPYTATDNNPDATGKAIYDQIIADGLATTYVPPTAAEVLAAKRADASMTPMQFALAVDAAGLTPQIEAYLADSTTPNTFKIMWNKASSFDRMNADLITAAKAIGLTDSQIDAVFGIV